jgi:hypothetical protein
MGLFLEFGSSVSQEYILLQGAKHLPPLPMKFVGFGMPAWICLSVGLTTENQKKRKDKRSLNKK